MNFCLEFFLFVKVERIKLPGNNTKSVIVSAVSCYFVVCKPVNNYSF